MAGNRETINEKISALNYVPEDILRFKGTTITEYKPKSGEMKNDTFVVTTKTKHEMSGDYDIAVPNAYVSITYPGALLVANEKLLEGKPTALSTERSEMAVTVDLPGLTTDNHIVVEHPDYKGVNGAIQTMLENWYATKGGSYSIPSNMQYISSILYDENSMALKFGCDVSFMQQKLGLDFSAIKSQKKSAFLMQFKQIFYTASVEPPKHPADVFAESVTWDEISRNINESNPPVYVQNVQYGREIYVLFESDVSSDELSAFAGACLQYKGVKLDANIGGSYKDIASSIKTQVVILGGKAEAIDTSGTLEEIISRVNKLISANVTLSKENPAISLCYTTAFLKDNISASILGKSEYITSDTETYTTGTLKLKHSGAYVARFNVDWDEVDFDAEGNEKLTKKQWGQNGKNKTAGYEENISLPANAKNIHVVAEGKTGLVWQPWTKSLDTAPMPLVKTRTVTISGTTLSQKAKVEPAP